MSVRTVAALLGVAAFFTGVSVAGDPTAETEVVVLLHGLGRSDGAMAPLAARLEAAGFRVHNLDYASTEKDPDTLVAELARRVAECCTDAPRLHFVGHSLGGILVRAYLARETDGPPANVGRVVMLAPPNRGSELVDAFGDWAIFRWALGPTAVLLGTDDASLPNQLPTPTVEIGVIAGTGTVNPIGSALLPGENDGMVSVERTKLEGMADFLTVDSSHAFIMSSDEVGQQVVHFLHEGRFERESAE